MKISVKKIFIILVFSVLIFSFFSNFVYGYDFDYEQFDKYHNKTGEAGKIVETAGSTIIALVQIIAVGVAVIMIVIIGITYVTSATSDNKVQMKKNLPNYIIGLVITFTAAVLLQIVKEFINDNVNS